MMEYLQQLKGTNWWYTKTTCSSKTLHWVKQARYCRIPLTWSSGTDNHGEGNQKSSCPPRGGVMWGDWLRRYKATFWSDKNVFSLVLDIGYMGVSNCQSLASWILMIWSLYKLYLIYIFLNKEENSESSCQDSRVRSYNVRTTKMRESSRDSLPNGLASLLQWRGC